MSGRIRTPTALGAEYTASLQAKKQKALARIAAKKASVKSESDINELADLFGRVSVANTDAEVDNLTDMLAKMGSGRRRKTHKRKAGKKSKKTRKH
jgi:hypothetical protein